MLLAVLPVTANIETLNETKYGALTFKLDSRDLSTIHVVNNDIKSSFPCKIKNWLDKYNSGIGVISITNDQKALLIYPTNKYILISELIRCNFSGVLLHKIPQSDDRLDTIIDINFKRKLTLLVALDDVRELTYTAILSTFDSNKNIISGPGFFDLKNKPAAFGIGNSFYVGKISLDGKYVHPYDLDCAFDSFPGVWNIKAKKKVIFPKSLGDDEINSRCQKLFNGEATLEALGGKLINPK